MKEKMQAFNRFIDPYTGTASNVAHSFSNNEGRAAMNADFFKPYSSKSDFFFRAASVGIAPVAGCIYALEATVGTLYFLLKTIGDLVTLNPVQACDDLGNAAASFLGLIAAVVFAIISPVINVVDLIGSAFSADAEHEPVAAP